MDKPFIPPVDNQFGWDDAKRFIWWQVTTKMLLKDMLDEIRRAQFEGWVPSYDVAYIIQNQKE